MEWAIERREAVAAAFRGVLCRPPRFGMTDHDEMTGATAWDDWHRRRVLDDDMSRTMRALVDHMTIRRAGDPPEFWRRPPGPPLAGATMSTVARPGEREAWRDLTAQVAATGRGSLMMSTDSATGRATFAGTTATTEVRR